MMRSLFILFLFFTLNASAQTDSVRVESLNTRLSELDAKTDDIYDLVNTTNGSVSNQLEASNRFLTVTGIVLGLLGIGLGVYLTFVERKVKALRDESVKAKDQAKEISYLIEKNITGLYKKMRREETRHLLERLQKIPEDIGNLSETLLTRELEAEDYLRLKEAYLFLKRKGLENYEPDMSGISYGDSYLLLFYQHFSYNSVYDHEMRTEYSDFHDTGMRCSFENDIKKSTGDFITAVIDLGYKSISDHVAKFFTALSRSKHKDLVELYQTIFDKLRERDVQFAFWDLIPSEAVVAKKHYGTILKNTHKDNLTTSEKTIITQIDKL